MKLIDDKELANLIRSQYEAFALKEHFELNYIEVQNIVDENCFCEGYNESDEELIKDYKDA